MLTKSAFLPILDPVGSTSVRSTRRHLIGAAVIAVMWWIAFAADERIPLLTWVNLGIHELGHMLTYSMSELTTTLMGSIAQVGVPVLLAVYFLVYRGDWLGTALCLAWGATSALEVAAYVADAPHQRLELIGDRHDWAFILGPEGYDALDRAAWLAQTIRDWALVALLAAVALCLTGAIRGQARPAESASARTAISSP